ncbi:MAG: hypothetical protein ABR924_09705 [Terracidiphilus sp.]|jgi:hypothetical protein
MSKQIISTGKPAVSSNKSANSRQGKVFCGIDASAESLAVAVVEPDRPCDPSPTPSRGNNDSAVKGYLPW